MASIIGISGSERKGSFNTSLLTAAAEVAPKEMSIEIVSIRGIPLYDGDLENEHGIPESVTKLKNRIAAADGFLLVTPEYNNSVPGVLKNAVDWLSRPPKDASRVFGDKAVAIMGATPGGGGTRLSQTAWLPVFRTLGARLWSGKQLYVGGAAKVFDAQGKLVDEKVKTLLVDFMAGFSKFISSK
jgi:chromate reductase, NAD(P)H dehydrogenase (quinone)